MRIHVVAPLRALLVATAACTSSGRGRRGHAGQGPGRRAPAGRLAQDADVTVGLADDEVVEVTSGLTGGEELAVPGPDLPVPTQDGATTPTGQRR